MPFDGLTISCLVNELNEELAGQRVEKIYQPEKDEITLLVRRRKGSSRLVISANARWARMHIASVRQDNPAHPLAFCMLLRKHLEGAKILAFEQIDFERIVRIRFEALNDLMEWQEKHLICEFTGKNSNIVLVDPVTNLILDGIKRYGSELSSYREVLPGSTYVPPPGQDKLNPLCLDYSEFYQAFWQNSRAASASQALFQTVTGLSPRSCDEILIYSGIDPQTPVDQCGEYELSRIHRMLTTFVKMELPRIPCVVWQGSEPVDYFAFEPRQFPGYVTVKYDTLNEAMDAYYSARLASVRLESRRSNLLRDLRGQLDKAYKKLYLQNEDLAAARDKEKLRTWGELLTAYAHLVKKGDSQTVLPDFEDGEPVEIELQPHLSAIENAQRYFRQYARSRKTRERLEELIKANQADIEYLESVYLAVEKAESIDELEDIIEELALEGFRKEHVRHRKERERTGNPRRFLSSDNLEIWVGKNNRQNDLLTLKRSNRSDLWFHVQGYPGTHVILALPPHISDIQEVPDRSIEEAALLAAYYSKARGAEKVPVDYTFRFNVRKPRGAHPGMVVYDNYWTIYVNPQDPRITELLGRMSG